MSAGRAPGLAIRGTRPFPTKVTAVERPSVQTNRAARHAIRAEDGAREFTPSGAHEAGEADDLAGADAQRRAFDAVRRIQLADIEHDSTRLVAELLAVRGVDVPSDHQMHEIRRLRVSGSHRRHVPAVAQHGDAIADHRDFLQAVRDVDDGDARRFERFDLREQTVDFVGGECCRRLVHHEDARVLRQRFGNLDDLLLSDAQFMGKRVRVEIHAERREKPPRLGVHLPVIDGSRQQPSRPRAPGRCSARGRVRNERKLLEDDRDAQGARVRRRGESHLLAVQQDFACVRMVRAAYGCG
jgi:hypothetical protein